MRRTHIISLCLLVGIAVCSAAYIGHSGSCSKNQVLDTQRKEADSIALSREPVERNVNDQQEIEKLYHAMYQYMLAKDIGKLSDILTDDFVLVHMTGLHQPKREYLRCIRDGELNYFAEKTDHIRIDLQGDKAVLTGQSRVAAAVFDGERHTWPLQLVIDMKKQEGKWMMTGARASTY